jgi:uncharacterized protein YukJ
MHSLYIGESSFDDRSAQLFPYNILRKKKDVNLVISTTVRIQYDPSNSAHCWGRNLLYMGKPRTPSQASKHLYAAFL